MLPAISALLGGGFCEKMRSDLGWAAADPTHRGDAAPVRFRLTPAGHALLLRTSARTRPTLRQCAAPGQPLAPVT